MVGLYACIVWIANRRHLACVRWIQNPETAIAVGDIELVSQTRYSTIRLFNTSSGQVGLITSRNPLPKHLQFVMFLIQQRPACSVTANNIDMLWNHYHCYWATQWAFYYYQCESCYYDRRWRRREDSWRRSKRRRPPPRQTEHVCCVSRRTWTAGTTSYSSESWCNALHCSSDSPTPDASLHDNDEEQ